MLPESIGRGLYLRRINSVVPIAGVHKQRHPPEARDEFMQKFQLFRPQRIEEVAHLGEVTVRLVEAVDEAQSDGIGTGDEDNRDGLCCRLCCKCRGEVESNDHCHVAANQFGRLRWQPVILTIGPAPFDVYVLTFEKAGGLQSLNESRL